MNHNMGHFVELIGSLIIILFSCLIYHCHLCNNSQLYSPMSPVIAGCQQLYCLVTGGRIWVRSGVGCGGGGGGSGDTVRVLYTALGEERPAPGRQWPDEVLGWLWSSVASGLPSCDHHTLSLASTPGLPYQLLCCCQSPLQIVALYSSNFTLVVVSCLL